MSVIARHCGLDDCSGSDGCECPCLGCDVDWHERRREFLRATPSESDDSDAAWPCSPETCDCHERYERPTPSESDALDLATLVAMVLTALAHPWELLDDVAPRLADRLARAWVWVDSKVVHAAWLASLGRPR